MVSSCQPTPAVLPAHPASGHFLSAASLSPPPAALRRQTPYVAPKPGPFGGRPLEFVFKSLQMPTKSPRLTAGGFCWRRRRDLNPRGAFYTPYSLSRGAPSATWVLLHIAGWYQIGGESGIRTHGCFHIAGFQDRCFRPLSHLSGYKSGGATPSIAEHSVP